MENDQSMTEGAIEEQSSSKKKYINRKKNNILTSLVVAFLAAVTAVVAGVMTDARPETIVLRGIKCLFIVWIVFYLVSIVTDYLGYTQFANEKNEMLEAIPQEEQSTENESEDDGLESDEESSEDADNSAQEDFVPLADDVPRV